MSFKEAKLLLLLIGVVQTTLNLPLTAEAVRSRLEAAFTTDVVVEPSSFFSYTRLYSGRLDEDHIVIHGPLRHSWFNSRRSLCLVTFGKISENSESTTLKLTVRLATLDAVIALLSLAWISCWQLVLGWQDIGLVGLIPVMIIYGALLCNFRYEATLILKLIRQVLLHPPQYHINSIKFVI